LYGTVDGSARGAEMWDVSWCWSTADEGIVLKGDFAVLQSCFFPNFIFTKFV